MKKTAIQDNQILQPFIDPPIIKMALAGINARAGFPSPADDYLEEGLDLNRLVIKHPAATFFVKAKGHSMQEGGIADGDYLAVDKSKTPTSGKFVIAAIDGELVVKRYRSKYKKVWLESASPDYPPIEFHEGGQELMIWGVVIGVIRLV